MPQYTKISRRQFALGTSALLPAAVGSSSVSTAARSQTPVPTSESESMEAFDQLVLWLTDEIERLEVPGAAIGVVSGDERFTHGIGVANVDSGANFKPSTQFGIASLTKIFTANSLALLAQDGIVSLDDPVRKYIPEFGVEDTEASETVTIGHLLSHAGGWADTMEPTPGQDSLEWYAANMTQLPQIAPVGSHFSYSNSGFLLVGAVLENLTGIPYEEVIAESLLRPLSMQNSGFTVDSSSSRDMAIGHDFADDELVAIPLDDVPRAVAPAAGLYSTLDDMLMFVSAHASAESHELNRDALESMRQPHISGGSVGPTVVDHIGIGWMVLEIDGETVLMSQGGDAGRMSAMIAVPSRQFGMVVFANSESAMMLVNDTVFNGLTTFTGISRSEPSTHPLTDDEAVNAEGRFELSEWMTFGVASDNTSLLLETSAGGEAIPDLSGPLTMVSATQGFLPYLGSKIWIDFVPDDNGLVQWVRFAGRLVPRSE